MSILRDLRDIEKMREGGHVLAAILNDAKRYTKAGTKTADIDKYVEELCKKHGVEAAFKGYMDFPSNICISLNDEVVHGLPSDRFIEEGDIVSLDFGVFHDGFYTDAGITFGIGEISDTSQRLIETAEKSFFAGASQLRDGTKLGDVSSAIQEYIENKGFGVVRSLAGHGIGRELHETPIIPNFGRKGTGEVLREGMVLAIEPMVTEKSFELEIAPDEWTYRTMDGGLTAYFEHTVIVTQRGYEILTKL